MNKFNYFFFDLWRILGPILHFTLDPKFLEMALCFTQESCRLVFTQDKGNISCANQSFHANHVNFNLDHRINIQEA